MAALNIIGISRKEEGNIPMTIYLDVSKAFDTINYTIWLDKLIFYGIQGCSLNLIDKLLNKIEDDILK